MRTAIGLTAIAAAIALSLGALDAQAQPYPTRSIKIVVPATPGGAIDMIARLVGDKLTAAMGQSVVIENKPGASNNLGTDFVAKSAARRLHPRDLCVAATPPTNTCSSRCRSTRSPTSSRSCSPTWCRCCSRCIRRSPPRPSRSWSPGSRPTRTRPRSPRAAGSSLHMAAELFRAWPASPCCTCRTTAARAAHPDLIGGRTAMIFDTITAIQPHVQSGAVRAIAVTTRKRSAALPDLPTIAEVRPRGLRRQHLGRHPGAGRHAQGRRRQAQRRDQQGARGRGRARQAGGGRHRDPGRHAGRVRRLIKAEVVKWAKVTKDAGIEAE